MWQSWIGCGRAWVAVAGLCLSILPVGRSQENRVRGLGQVAFTEGPVWHPDGSVYFTDVLNNRIMRRDASGTIRVFRQPSGRANGLVFDLQGRLLACEGGSEGGNRRITRTELNGVVNVVVDRFEGKRFNSPNDITIDRQGYIYFTDPRYGDRSDMEMLDATGQAIEGVYRVAPDGSVVRLLAHEVNRPNGIAISPDDRYLYVADNANDATAHVRKLWRFELNAERSIVPGSQQQLYDWGTDRGPDGMAINSQGQLYVTAGLNYAAPPHETAGEHKAAVYVISGSDGKLLETIPVPMDMVTNCAFGGEQLRTLFITAGHTLWSIDAAQPGYVTWLSQP